MSIVQLPFNNAKVIICTNNRFFKHLFTLFQQTINEFLFNYNILQDCLL